jgi:Flp pilus assembly protein TadG
MIKESRHSLKRQIFGLMRSTRGVAAVELALLAPLLLILTFGAVDIVRALRDYNVVSKSIRDSGRFLARVPIDCTQAAGSRIASADQTTARQLAMTGRIGLSPAVAANRLVDYWSADSTVTIQVNCLSNNAADNLCGGAGETIACRGENVIPVVTISTDIPYVGSGISLLAMTNMSLRASHNQLGISE